MSHLDFRLKMTEHVTYIFLFDYVLCRAEDETELEQKKGVLRDMESELSKAVQWNSQIDKSFHQCDVDLSRYSELTGQMTDRWRRIVAQIDSRYGKICCSGKNFHMHFWDAQW